MECSSPPPLTDDQLSAALDQVAAPDVIDHLAGAPAARPASKRRSGRAIAAIGLVPLGLPIAADAGRVSLGPGERRGAARDRAAPRNAVRAVARKWPSWCCSCAMRCQ